MISSNLNVPRKLSVFNGSLVFPPHSWPRGGGKRIQPNNYDSTSPGMNQQVKYVKYIHIKLYIYIIYMSMKINGSIGMILQRSRSVKLCFSKPHFTKVDRDPLGHTKSWLWQRYRTVCVQPILYILDLKNDTINETKLRISTIKIIKSNFQLSPISTIKSCFIDLFSGQNSSIFQATAATSPGAKGRRPHCRWAQSPWEFLEPSSMANIACG